MNTARRWLTCGAVLGLLLPGVCLSGEPSKGGDRPLTIAIEPLGYQELPAKFRSTVATMFTLHFVDEQHLLFTFTKRSLMPRLPDAEPDDDDRNVEAVLLELPTGHVMARTQWRTRDHDRYLWPLEHGRFLLRVRSRLTVIDPLRELQAGDAAAAFHEQTFLDLHRPIGYVHVSPGGDLLAVETLPPRKPKLTGVAADAAALAATAPGHKNEPELQVKDRAPVKIYFFRLHETKKDGKEQLYARTAGLVGAPNLINLPATGDGYLDIQKESSATWLLDFVSHTGKRMELAAFDTTCAPRPYFISRSEFVAFGCRGAVDKVALTYFNLKGEQPWINVLGGTHVSPVISAAPSAGRFALSRTLVTSALFDPETLTADDLAAQEITVMQNYDGRVLLKVQATPIQRTGQNFDLSPAGTQFAVMRAGKIEVYQLPALNGKDLKAVQMAASLAPEANDAVVKLNGVPVDQKVAEETEDRKAGASPAAAATAAAAAANADSPAASALAAAAAPPGAAGPAGGSAPPKRGEAEALPAGEAVQQTSRPAGEGDLGDVQGAARKAPTLYSPEYPRGKGDPVSSQKSETPQ